MSHAAILAAKQVAARRPKDHVSEPYPFTAGNADVAARPGMDPRFQDAVFVQKAPPSDARACLWVQNVIDGLGQRVGQAHQGIIFSCIGPPMRRRRLITVAAAHALDEQLTDFTSVCIRLVRWVTVGISLFGIGQQPLDEDFEPLVVRKRHFEPFSTMPNVDCRRIVYVKHKYAWAPSVGTAPARDPYHRSHQCGAQTARPFRRGTFEANGELTERSSSRSPGAQLRSALAQSGVRRKRAGRTAVAPRRRAKCRAQREIGGAHANGS